MTDLLFDVLLAAAVMPAWVGVVLTVAPMLFLAVLAGWSLGRRHTRRREPEPVESLTANTLSWLVERPEPEVPQRRRHRYPLASFTPEPDWVPQQVLGQVPAIVLPRPVEEATTVVIRRPPAVTVCGSPASAVAAGCIATDALSHRGV